MVLILRTVRYGNCGTVLTDSTLDPRPISTRTSLRHPGRGRDRLIPQASRRMLLASVSTRANLSRAVEKLIPVLQSSLK
jgi:hypothetical protein